MPICTKQEDGNFSLTHAINSSGDLLSPYQFQTKIRDWPMLNSFIRIIEALLVLSPNVYLNSLIN
jgi:hypothetical protein